jgi:hypothetical protein
MATPRKGKAKVKVTLLVKKLVMAKLVALQAVVQELSPVHLRVTLIAQEVLV